MLEQLRQPISSYRLFEFAEAAWRECLLLPAQRLMPRWLTEAKDFVNIHQRSDGYLLHVTRGGEAVETAFTSLEELAKSFEELRARKSAKNLAIVWHLPPSATLAKTIVLPAQALHYLRTAIDLQLEAEFPTPAQDVYVSSSVIEAKPENGKIRVNVMISKRSTIDSLIAELTPVGLIPEIITSATDDPAPPRSNFAPTSRRRRTWLHHCAILLGVAFLIQTLFVLALPLYLKDRAAAQLESRAEAVTKQALAINKSFDKIDAQLSGTRTAAAERAGYISVIEILDKFADKLPATGWLDRIKIRAHTVEVTGFAHSASVVADGLAQTPALGQLSYISPTSKDPQLDAERFNFGLARGQRQADQ